MGNLKPIDSALVKDVDYDLISPDTVGGEYIETIGAACENPDGYTSGSLFLGRENGVQHLYRVTAAIAFGETIILDTNCVYTTVSEELEGKAEESEVTSLNEALTNEVVTRATIGAHNLFSTPEGNGIIAGLTVIKNADESFSVAGGATSGSGFILPISDAANYADISKRLKPSTTYKFSVGVSYENMTLQVLCKVLPTDSFSTLVSTVNVSEVEFTTPASFTYIYARVSIPVSTAVPTMTLKPMIRLATDKDDTYLPYAMTNRELTENVIDNAYNKVISAANEYQFFNNLCADLSSKLPNSGDGISGIAIWESNNLFPFFAKGIGNNNIRVFAFKTNSAYTMTYQTGTLYLYSYAGTQITV